jgi:subtilisin family serine protease
VAGGIAITRDGREGEDYVDRIGHGTAVTAVIREKAPDAEIFAVKIFHHSLSTRILPLVHAIDWSVRNGMDVINLSLGTSNPAHEPVLRQAVQRVLAKGGLLIAAGAEAAVRWLPGSLPGVLPVELDWDCPREEYRTATLPDGRTLYRACGFPRPVPGIAPEHNLKGLSFAVANVTGLVARQIQTGSMEW